MHRVRTRHPVEEEQPLAVVDLVLDAGRHEAGQFLLVRTALTVQPARADAGGAVDLGIATASFAQAAFAGFSVDADATVAGKVTKYVRGRGTATVACMLLCAVGTQVFLRGVPGR